jgi:membrane fusion protein, multidrug efflux system
MRGVQGGVQGISILLVFLGLNLLAGCQDAAPPVQTEVSRPAEIVTVSTFGADSGLRFPGRVRAVQRAELAFNVPGQIVEFPAQPGDVLFAGAVIARLDPANYQSRRDAAQAEFDKARTDHERVRTIWEQSQAVARAEVDQKRTAMEVARSAYASARRDLEDTALEAPFDGVVARRHVENFQNVQAREPIVSLQNVDELEIVIHVPERVVGSEPRRSVAYAVFDVAPDRRVPVTVKSFATEADAQTQTYEVVLTIIRPPDLTILPGMSAEVLPDHGMDGPAARQILIPLKAVAAAADGQAVVWVVDPETSRVSPRPIELGSVRGSDVIVLGGLDDGERIVTAGIAHLRPGTLVHPL